MSKYRRRLMMNNADKILPDYLCFTALESGTFTLTNSIKIKVIDNE